MHGRVPIIVVTDIHPLVSLLLLHLQEALHLSIVHARVATDELCNHALTYFLAFLYVCFHAAQFITVQPRANVSSQRRNESGELEICQIRRCSFIFCSFTFCQELGKFAVFRKEYICLERTEKGRSTFISLSEILFKCGYLINLYVA